MNSEDNKDLEIVMGDDSDLNISEVGDMINDLKPNTNKEKKSIIIPISMNKSQNSDGKEESSDKSDEKVQDAEDEDLTDSQESENDESNNEDK